MLGESWQSWSLSEKETLKQTWEGSFYDNVHLKNKASVADVQTAQSVYSQHEFTLISEKGFRIEYFLVLCEQLHSTTEKSRGKRRFQIHWVNMNVTERAMENEEQQKQTNPSSANENSSVIKYYFIATNIINYAHIKELLRKNCFI